MDAISEFYLQQSAVRNSTTTLEKSSSPLIHRRGSYGGGCELRAPAPHLQHSRPPSTEVGLPHYLPSHAPTKLPIHRAPSNLSVPSCGLGKVTEPVKSQWQSNGINQPDIITGLPVIDGFLPTSTELLSQFVTPPKFTSAYHQAQLFFPVPRTWSGKSRVSSGWLCVEMNAVGVLKSLKTVLFH